MLHPVVEPMLAKAVEVLPGPAALARSAVEMKFDGYRTLLFTGCRTGGPVLLQTRRGSLIQGAFPDLVAAAREQLPDALVLDGELVVWNGSELSFAAVQRRASSGTRNARRLAAAMPSFYVAFDVLQLDGESLMTCPYTERRAALEALFAGRALTVPWTLCPMTRDPEVAREWLRDWTEIPGLEGVVIKPVGGRYTPGSRGGWTKLRRRDTTEAVIGAVTGTLARPQLLVLGRYDAHGGLRTVGRTTLLRPDAARQLTGRLTLGGSEHPWAGVKFTSAWGSREPLNTLLVAPELVAEISADTTLDGGVYRHPVRFVRLRLDQTPADMPSHGSGSAPLS